MSARDQAAPTAEAARLVATGAPRSRTEDDLRAAGVEIVGPCEHLSQRRDLLQEASLLHDFTPEQAEVLGRAMLLVRARPGQVLIAEDDPGDWMFLLLSGTLDVVKRKVDADWQSTGPEHMERLAVLKAGAAVGEMSMLDGEPRYASCIAISDVEAAVLTRAAVAQLINDEPAVGAKLLVKITQMLAQRLRNTSNQLVRQLQRSA
jgi:CRP-like cAMP-binding protein